MEAEERDNGAATHGEFGHDADSGVFSGQGRRPPLQTPAPSLPAPLRILFALNGATMQMPTLALMSILNDRARVPPAYLPAYGALSFLPWSLKPAYAYLSDAILRAAGTERRRRHVLLSILLALSGLSYVGTAFVPAGGVVPCFAWGFARGVAAAWPEFLLGLALVEEARRESGGRRLGSEGAGDGGGSDRNGVAPLERLGENGVTPRYEELGSVFQSQAATARNFGSLSAAGLTFVLFAWRHYRKVETELSVAVVTALLFLTAGLPAMGSAVAMVYKVGSVDLPEENAPGEGGALGRRRMGRYDGVATVESDSDDDRDAIVSGLHLELSPEQEEMRSEEGPITSLATDVVWVCLTALVGLGLVTAIIAASCYEKKEVPRTNVAVSGIEREAAPVPPRRLALYLILRHSVPSPGYVMYSFLYVLFSTIPLYMELLSIMGSVGSTAASWCYQRYLAKAYNSGWAIIGLIAVLTIAGAAFSLLDIITVHVVEGRDQSGDSDGQINAGLCLLVFGLYILTGFVAEIKFLPSLVLATTNVVSGTGCNGDISARSSDESESKTEQEPDGYDEGMQYASFVSCIDFGGQISSWATVPIISALGISRENGWQNLDWLIAICAFTHLLSVAFLWLIRPPHQPSIASRAGGILT